ncbi:ATP-binding protein [Rubrivirga sp. IMCC45206]|uniref:DNA polymerase III subunit n=1 Tax=Rubrivirga sp. IMCC45206 TaxID=3391614 RepID=UPI0039900496
MWSRVIGQERATDLLAHALASGRVAHAYLLHGPAGTGKRAGALAFAQALLCERRGRPGGPEGDACGTCLACTKAARLIHPDLHVYLPFPKTSKGADKDDRPGDYPERLARLAAEPYAPVDYRQRGALDDDGPSNKQVEHRKRPIDELLRREMTFVPAEGRHVVGVLTDADRIRTEAANSILKLLEEPGPDVVLLLTAERLDLVLPTILSRCQRVRFDPLPPETIEAALVSRSRVPADEAGVAARMADGSYTRALEVWGSPAVGGQRLLALEFVRAAFMGRPDKVAPVVQTATKLGREGLKSWLGLVSLWIRDLVLAQVGGPDAPIVNVDQAENVHKFVAALPNADLGAMADLVEQAADAIQANANGGLVLTTLALAMRDAMHGRSTGRLVQPLDVA